jgi:hypothetical protein
MLHASAEPLVVTRQAAHLLDAAVGGDATVRTEET